VTAGKASANGQWDLAAAAEAAASEQDLVPFTFAYKGKSYTIPAMKRWPARALAALGKGDLAAALTEVLGEDYEGLMDAGLTVGELETLFDKVANVAGLDTLPNSSRPALPATTRM
jgi:hypothetical protein